MESEGILSHEDQDFIEYQISALLWCISSPFLLLLGFLGNQVSMLMLQGRLMRRRLSSRYLQALCLADTGALMFGLLPNWILVQFGFDLVTVHDATCKLRAFLFYSCSDVSVWIICALTIDRLLALVIPHKKRVICSRGRIYLAIFIIILLAVAKNFSVLITRGIVVDPETGQTWCKDTDSSSRYYNFYIRPWLVFTMVIAIPFLVITSSNIAIICYMRKIKNSLAPVNTSRTRTSVASMTRMCLAVSCAFLLLVSPSMVLLVGRPHWVTTPQAKAKYSLASGLGSLCQYTNNALNFLLYCVSSRMFRRQIQRGCKKCRRLCCTKAQVSDQQVQVHDIQQVQLPCMFPQQVQQVQAVAGTSRVAAVPNSATELVDIVTATSNPVVGQPCFTA